jgi:hypothetical protein
VRFYLGTHHPHWLGLTDVPIFLSYRRLAGLRRLPRARGRWALDSGGFSELSLHGKWTVSAARYAEDVRRLVAEIGPSDFVAVQDWMCEPAIVAKTGLSVEEHQRRTIESYLELRELAPEVPWAPVLQGQVTHHYMDHVLAYERSGVDPRALPVVGIGSICRRQDTTAAQTTLLRLVLDGFTNLHGFGFKTKGLERVVHVVALGGRSLLASADSMAWSMNARRNTRPMDRLTNCAHRSCANCLDYALSWRTLLLVKLERRAAG